MKYMVAYLERNWHVHDDEVSRGTISFQKEHDNDILDSQIHSPHEIFIRLYKTMR